MCWQPAFLLKFCHSEAKERSAMPAEDLNFHFRPVRSDFARDSGCLPSDAIFRPNKYTRERVYSWNLGRSTRPGVRLSANDERSGVFPEILGFFLLMEWENGGKTKMYHLEKDRHTQKKLPTVGENLGQQENAGKTKEKS